MSDGEGSTPATRERAARGRGGGWPLAAYAAAFAALFGCWLAAARWLAPPIIRRLHAGEGPPLLTSVFAGRRRIPVSDYLSDWSDLAHEISALLFTLGLVGGLTLWFLNSLWPAARERRKDVSAGPSPPPGWFEIVTIGVWFGLLAGLGEAYYTGIKAYYLREIPSGLIRVSGDVLWLAPLAAAVSFGLLGGLLCVATAPWRGCRESRARLRVATTLYCALGLFGLAMATGWLHRWAAALLAVGLAVQAGRASATHAARFRRLVRTSTPWLLWGVVLAAVGIVGGRMLGERARASDLPPVTGERPPNVLFIVLDTERAASLSAYGYDRPTTPVLEDLAARGIVFERAMSTAIWTLPSHASLFTGRMPREIGVAPFRPLPDRYPMLAEVLAERGYRTGAFVANMVNCNDFYGFGRGFVRYDDQQVSAAMGVYSLWLTRTVVEWAREVLGDHGELVRKRATEVNREFLRWLSGDENERPFFAFLNYFDAHEPYLPPEPYDRAFTDREPLYWLSRGFRSAEYSAEEIAELRTAYDSGIAYLDAQLGVLFEALREKGMLDETLVIVTSDHGEEFGEHGWLSHEATVYLPVLHVPLIIVPPGGLGRGFRVQRPVSLADVAATVLESVDPGERHPFPGRSLLHASGRVGVLSWSEMVPSTHEDLVSLAAGDYHYIRDGDGREELYRVDRDPWERRNLAGRAGTAAVIDSFRAALDRADSRRPRAARPAAGPAHTIGPSVGTVSGPTVPDEGESVPQPDAEPPQ